MKRRGKERGLGIERICTFSHLLDTRQILWPAYPNQNLGCPGARSQWRLRPYLLQASQPGREVEKLTPSLSCQGLMLPGHWSRQCPHSQTGRAQVYADSIGLANCGVILGPWGTSQSFSDASNCHHRCQSSNAPSKRTQGLGAPSSNSPELF